MEPIDQLIQWATENGAVITPNLKFKWIKPGVIGGVYSQTSTNKTPSETPTPLDDKHISIPTKVAITLQDAIESFNYGAYGDFNDISQKTMNVNSLLKLYLARERSENYLQKSFYNPYLKLLPKLEDINSPYTWTPEDKSYIKGTNLGGSLNNNIGHLVEEWWQLINLLPQELPKPSEHFINMKFYYEYKFYQDQDIYDYFVKNQDYNNWTSFPNYLWASLILKSRSFPSYLIKEPNEQNKLDEAMLLPVVDLLNHDMNANTEWSTSDIDDKKYFSFKSLSVHDGEELFNNYGRKGNEELLLAYGFCTDNNDADTCALKIKVPIELLPEIQKSGVRLPKLDDYTTSVVRNVDKPGEAIDIDHSEDHHDNYKQYEDGLLFFISNNNIDENLILLFQNLVKNSWEPSLTLRLKYAGINQLRQAIELKINLINSTPTPPSTSPNYTNITIYVSSQKKILNSSIKHLKHLEKQMLTDPDIKPNLISLKNVYKKDKKFADALLISLGITSYDQLVSNNFQDQAWLLYLMRCHNKDQYQDEEGNYLPEWIFESFERITKQHKITPEEILQFKQLYEGLVLPMTEAAPEVFNRGVWTVEELIFSARLLDTISFTRGKEQECILVKPEP